MIDAAKVLGRLSPVGVALLILGALLGYLAGNIARRFFTKHEERAMRALRIAGLVFAVLGTLVLLDYV